MSTILKFRADPLGGQALFADVRTRVGGIDAMIQCVLTRADAKKAATCAVVFADLCHDAFCRIDAFEIERVEVPSLEEAAEVACFIVDRFLAGQSHPMWWARSWQEKP